MSETGWDRELVLVELGLVADILANTERIFELIGRTMAKNRKTDFTEQRERLRQAREIIDREWAKLREQRAKEAEADQAEKS